MSSDETNGSLPDPEDIEEILDSITDSEKGDEFTGSVTNLCRDIRARGGDQDLENELFSAVLEQLVRKARVILTKFPSLAHRLDPEEVVNSVFQRLRKQLIAQDMADTKHFFGIACQNFAWFLLDEVGKPSGPDRLLSGHDPAGSDTGPSTQAARGELFERILHVVSSDSFPEKCRTLLQFRMFFDFDERRIEKLNMPFREIAAELGIAVGTAHGRYIRCVARLRAALGRG